MVSKLSQKNNDNSKDLDEQFEIIFNKISELREAVAPDEMLKLCQKLVDILNTAE